MKIENLVEKDTVLDDDYLIVDGTDGTKKAKKSTLLSDVNSRRIIQKAYTNITTDQFGFFSNTQLTSDISDGYKIISGYAKDAAYAQEGGAVLVNFSVNTSGGIAPYGYLYKVSGSEIAVLKNARNVTLIVTLFKSAE